MRIILSRDSRASTCFYPKMSSRNPGHAKCSIPHPLAHRHGHVRPNVFLSTNNIPSVKKELDNLNSSNGSTECRVSHGGLIGRAKRNPIPIIRSCFRAHPRTRQLTNSHQPQTQAFRTLPVGCVFLGLWPVKRPTTSDYL